MNEQEYIDELIDAGATDEEIAEALVMFRQRQASQAAPTPVAQEEKPATTEPSLIDYPMSVISGINRGVGKLVHEPLKLVGAAQRTLATSLGYPEGVPLPIHDLTQLGEGVEKFTEDINYRYDNVPSFIQDVGEGVGQAAGMLATAGGSSVAQGLQQTGKLATGLIPAAGRSLFEIGKQVASPVGFLGGSVTAVPEWEAAKEAGLSDQEAFETLLKNYLVGQTDAIPIINFLSRWNRITNGAVMARIKNYGSSGLQEFLQEGFQTYLTNQIAKTDYDPDRDPMFQVLESASVGGVVGLLFPVLGSAMQLAPPKTKLKLQQKMATLAANEEIAKANGEELNEGVDKQVDEITNTLKTVTGEQAEPLTLTETTPAAPAPKKPAATPPPPPAAERSNPRREAIIDKVNNGQPITIEEATFLEESEARLTPKTLVDDFDQTGALLGGAEESKKATLAAASEQVADFLRGKITTRGEAVDFQDEWNQKHPERPITNTEIETAWNLIKPAPREAGPTVTLSVADALKQQIKTFYRGVEKGVRKGQDLKNELLVKIREAVRGSKLSSRQSASLISKVKATNLFTPGSVSKLNTFIDKVVGDAQYAEKLGAAKRGVKNIRSSAKTKGLTVPEKKLIGAFLTLNPTEVDIDPYLEKMNQILDSFKPATKGFKAAPQEEINRYVLETLQQQYRDTFGAEFNIPTSADQIIQALEDQRLRDKRAEILSGDFTEEEIDLLLSGEGSVSAQLNEAGKLDKARELLANLAEQAKNDLVDADEATTNPRDKKILSSMIEVDLSLLTPDQLKFFIKAADKIKVNNDFGGLGNFEAIAEAQKNFKTMMEDKLKNSNILSLLKTQAKYSSLPQLTQAVFGGISEDAAMFQLYMGITGVADANAKSVKAEERFIKGMDDLRSRFPQAFVDDSRFRRGVYKALVAYEEGVDPAEALAENKEFIEQDLKTFERRGDKESFKALEKLYKPFRDNKTIKEVRETMERIDPAGLKVADFIVDHYKKEGMAQRVKDYNFYYFNEEVPEIINYSGERRWTSIGAKGVEDFQVDPNEIRRPSINRIGKPRQARSAQSRKAIVKKDKDGNILPNQDNKVMSYNMDGVAASNIKQTVFELEAIPFMIQVRENANRKTELMRDLFGWREGDEDSQERAERIYRSLFDEEVGAYFSLEKSSLGYDLHNKSDFDKGLSSALSTAREIGYAATLSGPSQVIKQSTVLANVLWKLGKDAGLLSLTDVHTDEAKAFLAGRSVATREQQSSIFNIGETVDQKNINQQVEKFVTKNSNTKLDRVRGWLGGLKFLTKTDASVAQMSYLAFYKQYLKKKGLKFRGWVEEKASENNATRKEAHAYAKQRVDVLQTVSNPQEQAAAMKDGKISSQLLKVAVIPFGTFGLNQRLRLVGDVRAMMYGNSQQRKAGASDFAATAVEVASFAAISSAVRIGYGAMIIALAKSIGLVGEDEEEFEEKLAREWKLMRTRWTLDMLPTMLMAPEQSQSFLPRLINYATFYGYNLLNPSKKLTQKEFEKEVGMPFFSFEGRLSGMDQFLDLLGVYGRPLGLIVEGGTDIAAKFDDESTLTPAQKDFSMLVGFLQLASLSRGVPSDVRYALDRELNRQKRLSKESGSGASRPESKKSFKRKRKTFKRDE